MARTVSIAGHKDDLVKGINGLLAELESQGFGSWGVAGNGTGTPDLELECTVESAEEFTEPVVDYEGG